MGGTVLLVDDSATIRSFLKVYVVGHNFDCVEAESGERALQLARLMRLDLIIADIKMPGMDGFDFVRQLRSSERSDLKILPVILMTGDKAEMLRRRAMDVGASDFLRKPFSTTELIEVFKKFLPVSRQ